MATELHSDTSVYLTETPDYQWHAGCFGTASGNLIGFWDRHGFPNFYKGPTNKGVAPLNSVGVNREITALWASEAGIDGRPFNQPGHIDDYYGDYESVAPDPFTLQRREEHTPDCIGDFLGLNQDKWKNLNGECDGNIDGFSFVFWDSSGERRTNYVPIDDSGAVIPDIQGGLRAWTRHCGYDATTITQLADFNPKVPQGKGFSFQDLRNEIDQGYPVLLFMQDFSTTQRTFKGRPNVNPNIHGMMAYGYLIEDDGSQFVRYRTSWASGSFNFSEWNSKSWTPEGILNLPLRGVILYRPAPKLFGPEIVNAGLRFNWHAPRSFVLDETTRITRQSQAYVLESSTLLNPDSFKPVSSPTTALELTLPLPSEESSTQYYRLRVVPNP